MLIFSTLLKTLISKDRKILCIFGIELSGDISNGAIKISTQEYPNEGKPLKRLTVIVTF